MKLKKKITHYLKIGLITFYIIALLMISLSGINEGIIKPQNLKCEEVYGSGWKYSMNAPFGEPVCFREMFDEYNGTTYEKKYVKF